jgi:hypothetical protein
MTDYYPLIGRAIAGLDKNTGESRRALYERARTALVAQLRGLDPPLTESEITRERLALEEAIRKVEAEAARKARLEVPRLDKAPPPPAPARREEPPAPRAEQPEPPPPRPEPPRPEPPPRAEASRRDMPASTNDRRASQPPPPGFADAASKPPRRGGGRERPPPLTDEGLKGFRDVVAEAETLGEATAQAARTAREAYVAVPGDDPELDRMEPRLEPAGLRTPVREGPPRGFEGPPRPLEERPGTRQPEQPRSERTPPPRAASSRHASVISDRPPRSTAALFAATMAVLVIVGLAVAAFWWREPIKGWFGVRNLPSPTQPEEAATKPKIPDRVGQPSAPRAPAKDTQVAAVAQRVVLYEEDPADPQGKRYTGSAIWRTETVSPGPGQAPELAVRADFEIPDRRMAVTMSIRRNTDQALPASHTIELTFNLPSDFPFGGITNVPTILMKQEEQARGAPLAGLVVKVTPTFFLVGLSSGENEMKQNIALLKERAWFDIPIVYGNNRRAILAVEKGNPGDRAFAEAFAAWGQ